MLIENMRSEVEDMYPGERWKKKVARMSDKQVMAIYHSNYDRKKQREKKMKELGVAFKKAVTDVVAECDQLSFDDLLGGSHEKLH